MKAVPILELNYSRSSYLDNTRHNEMSSSSTTRYIEDNFYLSKALVE